MTRASPLPVLLLLLLAAAPLRAQTLVANPAVPQDHIDRNTARAYFYMRLREWPDGTPVRVFVLGDRDPLHGAFSREVLKVVPDRLRIAWDRMVYAGVGQAPEQLDGVSAMRERVAHTPGAIGYLPEEAIDGSVRALVVE